MLQAIRKIAKIRNHRIILELPKNFTGDMAEIIILPHRESSDNESWQRDFLSVSQWDSDVKEMSSWQIEEF
jgi:hypothetical protein